jgi:Fic-DOC domain mobile mystery protein B
MPALPTEGEDDANTPITAEERDGLIPAWIVRRSELNEAEQASITSGAAWAYRTLRRHDVLTDGYIRRLHKQMFDNVWTWAGRYRASERNLGIEAYRIDIEIRALLDDVRYWVENGTYGPDEIAIRFHHRLVSIHPFPNGNGRHTRLIADLLVTKLGRPPFSWGGGKDLVAVGDTRRRYVEALRAADNHDLAPLLAFARS